MRHWFINGAALAVEVPFWQPREDVIRRGHAPEKKMSENRAAGLGFAAGIGFAERFGAHVGPIRVNPREADLAVAGWADLGPACWCGPE